MYNPFFLFYIFVLNNSSKPYKNKFLVDFKHKKLVKNAKKPILVKENYLQALEIYCLTEYGYINGKVNITVVTFYLFSNNFVNIVRHVKYTLQNSLFLPLITISPLLDFEFI